MFKNQLPISLGILIAFAGVTAGRFLQPSNSSSNGTIVISPNPTVISTPKVTYSSSLNCGECILGGYTFCINAPENYTGAVAPQKTCCQNFTQCAAQARNASWTCSSKYNDTTTTKYTIFDRLKVCPYDPSCGPQNLSLESSEDAQCLRVNQLKKGSSCVYRVQSKCNTANFTLNDTSNVYTQSLLVKNTTLVTPVTPVESCSASKNEQCLCRSVFSASTNSTAFVCDCVSVKNMTVSAPSTCQCQTLKDSLNNTLSSCSCPVSYPVQYFQDQECACQRSTNVATNTSTLSCTGCSVATAAKPVTFMDNQCQCVNAFDFSTNKTYLSCVCKNVPQCADPSSFVQPPVQNATAPCKTSYPCSCAQNGTSSLACQCSNPSTGLSASISQNTSQCACSLRTNLTSKTFDQQCQCCLSDDFVAKNLIGPVVCSTTTDIKESCACVNQTVGNTTSVTTLSCNCMHPVTSVVSSGLQYPSQGECDCDNNTLGNKTCQCCVPQDIQVAQQQPVCTANSSIQSCQSLGGNAYSCLSSKTGFTFANVQNLTSCFCLNQKTCNCCVSEDQFKVARPTCPAERDVSQCKCNNVNGTLACTCTNQYFFNQSSIVSYRPSNCACFGVNSTDCQCCTTPTELYPAAVCSASESSVNCSSCKFDSVTKTVQCGCTGSHFLSSSVQVSLSGLTLPSSSCQCTVTNGQNTNCNCCVSRNTWAYAVPTCNSSQSVDRCMCKNSTFNTTERRNISVPTNVTKSYTCRQSGCSGEICSTDSMASLCTWQNKYACYASAVCEYQNTTGKCDWTATTALTACLAKPPVIATTVISKYQNNTKLNVTTTNITTLVNVTQTELYNATRTIESCSCNSSRISNMTFSGQVNSTQCGLDATNSSIFQCCASRDYVDGLFFNRQSCGSSLDTAQCECNSSRNATCSCVPLNTRITYRNLVLDTSKCQCLTNATGTGQNCRCCIGKMETLLPKAPSCASAAGSSQVCDCDEVFSAATNKTNLRCNCKQNVTTLQNMTQVVYVNVTRQVNVTYNMTINVTVPVNTTTNTSTNTSGTNTSSSNATSNATSGNKTSSTTNSTSTNATASNATSSTNATSNATSGNKTTTNTTTSTNATNATTSTNATSSNATANVTTNTTTGGNKTNGTISTNATSNATTTTNATNATNATSPVTPQPTYIVVQKVVEVTELKNVTTLEARNQTTLVNVTTVQTSIITLLTSQCSCLQYLNNGKVKNQCTCCVPSPFVCNASSTAAQLDCSCRNQSTTVGKVTTVSRVCNCLRKDNNVLATFPFALNQCGCNPADNSCQCCLNTTQYASMIPVLTCNASTTLKESCSCRSQADGYSCNCTRPDNGIMSKNDRYSSSDCLAPYRNSSFQCCVPQQTVDRQIPTKSCLPVSAQLGQNVSNQYCKCQTLNMSSTNATTNVTTRYSMLNCQCTSQDFLYTATYNYTTDRCLVYNASVADCCVTDAEKAMQMPSLSCSASAGLVPSTGCKCQSKVVNGQFDRTCDCGVTYQSKQYTVFNLSTAKDSCMCNSTTCGCCVQNSEIISITERQCANNEFRSTCDSCVSVFNNRTNTSALSCGLCTSSNNDRSMIFFNQSYTGVSQDLCLCRNNNATTNCTCCSTQKPAGPVAPTCPANFSEVLPTCACSSLVNGTQQCDCSRTVGSVESYFPNITARNCSCIVVKQDGEDVNLCQCCASTAQVTVATPVCPAADQSVEQCSCSANFNCDCKYKNFGVTIVGLQKNATTCGCPNNNATSKACSCCVSFESYKDALTPSCSNSDVIGTCQCTNVTTVVNKVSKVTQRCNCTGELKSERGTILTNSQSLEVTPKSCGGRYNESSRTFQKCCIADSIFSSAPTRQCRVADQISGTCTFYNVSNATTKTGFCSSKVNKTTYNFEALTVNSADCTCNDFTNYLGSGQKCNCCLNKTLANSTTLKTPTTCNASASSAQQCTCKNTDSSSQSLCDCVRKVGNTQSTRYNLSLDKAQCSCINQTVDGQDNVGTCQCCVPNPPPTQCELLAQPKPSNLKCKCAYVVINGVSDFRCDCNSTFNATYSVSRRNLSMTESSCCCVELSDPITRKGYKSCNCTQPSVVQTQNCQCKAVQGARNNTRVNCDCSNCASVTSKVTIPLSQCKCPAGFYNVTNSVSTIVKAENSTNATTNGTKTNVTTNSTGNTSTGSNSTNASSGSNSTTKSNATTNATTGSNSTSNATSNSTGNATNNGNNTSNNGTKTNTTTNGTSTGNSTSNNGTKTNTTTNGTTGSNTTTNGTTNSTGNATNTGNTTANGTKTNTTTNGTTGSNTTTNGTSNSTGNATITGNNTTNGTKTNTTNSTTTNTTTPVVVDPNVFGCSCEVEFSGLCPAYNPYAPVDESQCDASNRQTSVAKAVNAACKYQYEYLVAVVATNKDASLLMQLQTYQNVAADASTFLNFSMAALFALAASVLFFF